MSRLGIIKRLARTSVFRRFCKDRSGATAVEFALVSTPFFFLLFAMIEIASIFYANTILENAVLETARQIRTGQAQTSGMTPTTFRAQVCNHFKVIGDCSKLEIDVKVFKNFGSVDHKSPIMTDGSLDTSGFGWNPGKPGDIVLVRVFYKWKMITPNFGAGFANMKNNQRLLTAATVFRNEPYED